MQKKFKIKKGDTVKVIAGAAIGQEGTILELDSKKQRVYIEGLSVVNKKHVKPNPNKGETGGIIEKESPIRISNLGIYNPNSKKVDRIGFKTLEDGKKVRVFKSDGEVVDVG